MKKIQITTLGFLLATSLFAGEALPINQTFKMQNGKVANWRFNDYYKKKDGSLTGKAVCTVKDGKNILHLTVSGGNEAHFYSSDFSVNEKDTIITKINASGKGTLRVSFYCYGDRQNFITILQSPRVKLSPQPRTYEFKTRIKSPAGKKISKSALALMCDDGADMKVYSLNAVCEKAAKGSK